MPHSSEVKLEAVVVSGGHIVLFQRIKGLQQATVYPLPRDGSAPTALTGGRKIAFDEPAYSLHPGEGGPATLCMPSPVQARPKALLVCLAALDVTATLPAVASCSRQVPPFLCAVFSAAMPPPWCSTLLRQRRPALLKLHAVMLPLSNA